MSRFRNIATGVVVSVADEKDDRFTEGWESPDNPRVQAKHVSGRTKKES